MLNASFQIQYSMPHIFFLLNKCFDWLSLEPESTATSNVFSNMFLPSPWNVANCGAATYDFCRKTRLKKKKKKFLTSCIPNILISHPLSRSKEKISQAHVHWFLPSDKSQSNQPLKIIMNLLPSSYTTRGCVRVIKMKTHPPPPPLKRSLWYGRLIKTPSPTAG